MELTQNGVYLVQGNTIIPDDREAEAKLRAAGCGEAPSGDAASLQAKARRGTMAYRILKEHNTSGSMQDLQIRFDKMVSHDITFVGIIQTARASGLEKFPIPYVLTNCHNSLCAVGGTINEDDHMFGLSCAKRYGGVYVPPHQAVIHQYAREMLAGVGKMILGSDSHTRYGALGTMAMGEGGPELVKQLLNKTYDIAMPEVVAVYLTGRPLPGVGPQDVALAIIGAVFDKGYVKNKVMEFVGPGVAELSADFRIGVDVMTTETTCLSSIWQTDDRIKAFYEVHGRTEEYAKLEPEALAYYDGCIRVELDKIRPMIAMPFHPSNVYTIEECNANLEDILEDVEKRAAVSLGGKVPFTLKNKIRNGRLLVDQGIIAGCAGGGFENICEAADILRGQYIGCDDFTLSVYPASTPIYMELAKNGVLADLIRTGAIVKTAFCGPCFGAGDTPANGALSIRHSTRNFPNREGSKVQSGQIASVALMDARSIAATAANRGYLTPATEFAGEIRHQQYHFDSSIYAHRVFDSHGKADPSEEVRFGPNIKDWPAMPALPENLLLKVVSEIHDPVTTTDELIPSGETSSYRSNPLALAEFALSRKDPAYVGRAKAVQAAQHALEAGKTAAAAFPEMEEVIRKAAEAFPVLQELLQENAGTAEDGSAAGRMLPVGVGSAVFAVKPGDGSAREQAASCQKVLGGWANIANEYATKRYRSNLINWGMLPFLIPAGELPFVNGDYLFIPDIRKAVTDRAGEITVWLIGNEQGAAAKRQSFVLQLGEMTDDEREIILDGCLINYYRRTGRK
ncbi:MAG: hydratase [Eubacterium sp.]|nr:hydratase [Eubacterium sp.]